MMGTPSTPVWRELRGPSKLIAFLGDGDMQEWTVVPHSQLPPHEGGFCSYVVRVYVYRLVFLIIFIQRRGESGGLARLRVKVRLHP
jgi:hypothetical protein